MNVYTDNFNINKDSTQNRRLTNWLVYDMFTQSYTILNFQIYTAALPTTPSQVSHITWSAVIVSRVML